MKTCIISLVALMCAASAASALEKYDPSASGNVPVRVTQKATGKTSEGFQKRTYTVSLDRSEYVSADTYIEFFLTFQEKNKHAIMLVEKVPVTKMPHTFEFTKEATLASTKFDGWMVRVVRDGKIVGVGGHDAEFLEMAKDDELYRPFRRTGRLIK